jgi:hypothetical protein
MKRKAHDIETANIVTSKELAAFKQQVVPEKSGVDTFRSEQVERTLMQFTPGCISYAYTLPCTRLDFWKLMESDANVRMVFTRIILSFCDDVYNQGCGSGVYLEFPNLIGNEDALARFQLVSTPAFDAHCIGAANRSGIGNAFSAHSNLSDPHQSMIAFPNISGDAWLVVPNERYFRGHELPCMHLAAFLRAFFNYPAAADRVHDLWVAVAKHVLGFQRCKAGSDKQLYVSTHGTGVSWLHVRVSDTPKYYAGQMHLLNKGMNTIE